MDSRFGIAVLELVNFQGCTARPNMPLARGDGESTGDDRDRMHRPRFNEKGSEFEQ